MDSTGAAASGAGAACSTTGGVVGACAAGAFGALGAPADGPGRAGPDAGRAGCPLDGAPAWALRVLSVSALPLADEIPVRVVGPGVGPGLRAADFLVGGGSLASFSFSRRSTGASTVEEADRTNSPMSFSMLRTVLLSTPSSFASS